MGIPVIRLSSVTYAIRGQKLLEQRGIRCNMRKLSRGMNVKGCGYGLDIYGDVHAAVDILRMAGIRILEVSEG
jgi:hypothetical protein